MLPIKTILHATDFSERSNNAFRVACALARDYHARLILLHVLPPAVVGYPDGIILAQPDDYRAEARAKLQNLQPGDPALVVERMLGDGDAATTIVDTARNKHCDLIVVGTHGWTGLTRLLMGSVAEVVVRQAACPVLTVKTPFVQAERVAAARRAEDSLTPQPAAV
jgi:nucleotide-binding universal stress UspA family protein